jgi:hypothetical protein
VGIDDVQMKNSERLTSQCTGPRLALLASAGDRRR